MSLGQDISDFSACAVLIITVIGAAVAAAI